jgi:exodeoxyribonuclease VII large subunit
VRALTTLVERRRARVEHASQLLTALSYRSVLARGFALVRDQTGHPLHAAAAIAPGAQLSIEFADGRIAATADGAAAAPAPAEPKPSRRAKAEDRVVGASKQPDKQGSLF